MTGAAIDLQDVTRLFRFDELKNDLVATVAHEFRTPLTSLRMALHLCTEEVVGPLTPKQADLLFAAREDCERLQIIVDDLLNLSRIESGRIDLHRRRVEPGSLVDAVVDVHRAAAEQAERHDAERGAARAAGGVRRSRSPAARVHEPADQRHPVLAARAAARSSCARDRQPRERRAPVAERRTSGSRSPTRVPGSRPSTRRGLFEKFFRVPGSPEGGSGLGLFIAKGLVQAHGGEIGDRQRRRQRARRSGSRSRSRRCSAEALAARGCTAIGNRSPARDCNSQSGRRLGAADGPRAAGPRLARPVL